MRRKCSASGHGMSSPGFIKYGAKGCRGGEMADEGVVSKIEGSLGCGRRCLLREERNIVSWLSNNVISGYGVIVCE